MHELPSWFGKARCLRPLPTLQSDLKSRPSKKKIDHLKRSGHSCLSYSNTPQGNQSGSLYFGRRHKHSQEGCEKSHHRIRLVRNEGSFTLRQISTRGMWRVSATGLAVKTLHSECRSSKGFLDPDSAWHLVILIMWRRRKHWLKRSWERGRKDKTDPSPWCVCTLCS